MFCIGICDDDEGLCGELEKMLYDYGKENKLQMNIDIWYQGESLCRFLRENKKILDVLFLDIELLTTNGIEVGRFIREEQENMETAIVYISANSSYAMDLFRVQPTDFLIKPLDKIKVVLKYIENNYMNRISIADIAATVDFSESHFMRYFKETMGTSFVDYLRDYRLTMASRLLTTSDSAILDIASETGFDNLSYFNRVFKKKYGMTPRQFRSESFPGTENN